MRFDDLGVIVRDNGDTGDSMAETARYMILHDGKAGLSWFSTERGFKRHPKSPWPESDMSNDQLVPWLLAGGIYLRYLPGLFIPGTRTLMQPATLAIKWGMWRVLNWLNVAQGWLLTLPFRWSDDETEGRGFRSSKLKVQDYLNMICIWWFLHRNGHPATLPRPARECYWAVWRYYARGADPEPNSRWIRRAYFRVLASAYKRERRNVDT